MTYDELLSKVKEKADAAPALGASLKFQFDDDQFIFINGQDGSNTVSTEDGESDCTIKLSMEDFKKKGDKFPFIAFLLFSIIHY